MRPVKLMYGDIGGTEKVEKDRTLMLRPIVTDRTRPVTTGTLLRPATLSSYVQSSLDR